MSEKPKGQNDKAWEAIFEKYEVLKRIDGDDRFYISAAQMKEYREPRLMAKFDHKINLPRIFAEHGLAILPVSRGDYVISHFEAYEPFQEKETAVSRVSLPAFLESLKPDSIPSEALAINCALASGMLSDFLGEERVLPTVSGRMGSGSFAFEIQNTRTGKAAPVKVEHSQIEIDAAYEGMESLALLEAKRDISEDFLVRQLYYPYRVFSGRVQKKVRPVFLVYSNGIFSLYEYAFQRPEDYNSLVLIRQKNYSLSDTGLSKDDLMELARRPAFVPEPKLPFPQADNFNRIVNLCELLSDRELSREDVTQEYAFDIRQTNYYTDAGRYLGLIEKRYDPGRRPVYALSEKGGKIMNLGCKSRQLAFCRCILEHRVFYEVFRQCAGGEVPDRSRIAGIMKKAGLYGVESDATYERRASTVSGWLHWILGRLAE